VRSAPAELVTAEDKRIVEKRSAAAGIPTRSI
jgi:hypothetical protein